VKFHYVVCFCYLIFLLYNLDLVKY